MSTIIFIFLVILLGFLTGQILYRKASTNLDKIKLFTTFLAMRFTIPLSVMLAIWQLELQSWHLIWLPIIGSAILLSGFLIGWLVSKSFRLPDIQRAVVAPAGAFTNISAIGSLVVFVYLGETAFALVPLFKLLEEFIYFGFLFPYAKRFSTLQNIKKRALWKDPTLQAMFAALTLGATLNFTEVVRPDWFKDVTSVLIPLGTFSMMISVGLVFRFKTILQHWKIALALSLSKQMLLPVIAYCLVVLTGQAGTYDGLILQIAVLIATMPIAFIVILPASIYKLDQDLANSCWVMSSVVFLIMLPFYATFLV